MSHTCPLTSTDGSSSSLTGGNSTVSPFMVDMFFHRSFYSCPLFKQRRNIGWLEAILGAPAETVTSHQKLSQKEKKALPINISEWRKCSLMSFEAPPFLYSLAHFLPGVKFISHVIHILKDRLSDVFFSGREPQIIQYKKQPLWLRRGCVSLMLKITHGFSCVKVNICFFSALPDCLEQRALEEAYKNHKA